MLRFSLDGDAPDATRYHADYCEPLCPPSMWCTESPFLLPPLPRQPFSVIDQALDRTCDQNQSQSKPPPSDTTDEQNQSDLSEDDIWTTELPPLPSYALSWERLSQPTTYTRESLTNQGIGTAFLTEAPLSVNEPAMTSLIKDTSTSLIVKEYHLVKCLVEALTGSPSACFRWDSSTNTFQSRVPHLRLLGVSPGELEGVISVILIFGGRLRRLGDVSNMCRANPSKYGLVGMSFGCCLAELHLHIHQAILSLPPTISLLQVHQFTDSFSLVIERLSCLCCLEKLRDDTPFVVQQEIRNNGFYIPFGPDLLSLLANEVKTFDFSTQGNSALYKDICLALLCETSRPYLDILSRWLGLMEETGDSWAVGQEVFLWDPYNEFFVVENMTVTENGEVRRYKLRKEQNFPWCIDPQQADQILRAGNSLRLLQEFQPENSLCSIGDTHPVVLECCVENPQLPTSRTDVPLDTETRYSLEYALLHDTKMEEPRELRIPVLSDTFPQGKFITTLERLMGYRSNQDSPSSFVPTLETIVNISLYKPLHYWCPLLNTSAMSLLLHKFCLKDHLDILHRFFLFGDGTFVSGITRVLFAQDEPTSTTQTGLNLGRDKTWPPRASELHSALRLVLIDSIAQLPNRLRLEESITQCGRLETLQDLVSFSIRPLADHNWVRPSKVEALDFLSMTYRAYPPLSLFITSGTLEKYGRLFSFLLPLLRLQASTQRSFYLLHPRCTLVSPYPEELLHTLGCVRFQMNHFMNALCGFVFDMAIGATWESWMTRLERLHTGEPTSDPLDEALGTMDPVTFGEYHEHILDRILFQCFLKQNQKPIMNLLRKVFKSILVFVDLLESNRRDDEWVNQCKSSCRVFRRQAWHFVQMLRRLEDKGIGRLGNMMNSLQDQGKLGVFGDWHEQVEAKRGLEGFVKDLLHRLSQGGWYEIETTV
ncbi:Spc98 family-domain-containing protein [Phycomyces blakesleeanus]|uniref:Spindle pole body component n=1 Tax=Phycomyces blakesleeanus TaxID=4837 RepID=A0ABR3B5V6_PHYBL